MVKFHCLRILKSPLHVIEYLWKKLFINIIPPLFLRLHRRKNAFFQKNISILIHIEKKILTVEGEFIQEIVIRGKGKKFKKIEL